MARVPYIPGPHLNTPQNVHAVPGGATEAVVSWDAVSGAVSYNLYVLDGPDYILNNPSAVSPQTVGGLDPGQQFFKVSAVFASGEGPLSAAASCTVT